MIVIRRTPVNRLSKLVPKPGGATVDDAIAAAEKNLQSVREECLRAMDEKLALITQAVIRCRTAQSPEDIDALYSLSNDVLEVAGAFSMKDLGQAALSLCDLVDRFRTHNRWSQAALDVHLNGLIALRAADGQSDAFTNQVLDGLKKVAERVSRGAETVSL